MPSRVCRSPGSKPKAKCIPPRTQATQLLAKVEEIRLQAVTLEQQQEVQSVSWWSSFSKTGELRCSVAQGNPGASVSLLELFLLSEHASCIHMPRMSSYV
eukprot:1152207-Pelagomonas_calceolata.AAC.2